MPVKLTTIKVKGTSVNNRYFLYKTSLLHGPLTKEGYIGTQQKEKRKKMRSPHSIIIAYVGTFNLINNQHDAIRHLTSKNNRGGKKKVSPLKNLFLVTT